jgi:hypothetical protein
LRYPVENTDDYPQFGSSIVIFRNRMIVGAPMDDRTHSGDTNSLMNRGAAFSYFRSPITETWEWTQQRLSMPSDARPGDMFGANIVMNVSCVAIAAPNTQIGGN